MPTLGLSIEQFVAAEEIVFIFEEVLLVLGIWRALAIAEAFQLVESFSRAFAYLLAGKLATRSW